MNWHQSYSFIHNRQMAIVALLCDGQLSLETVLALLRKAVVQRRSGWVIADRCLGSSTEQLSEYLKIRDQLLPETKFLFPTKNGFRLTHRKFHRVMRRYLEKVLPGTPYDPENISQAQWQRLLALKFEVKRYQYQNTLAVALLVYLALRPSEVAHLRKKDIDFAQMKIHLRRSKSQDNQIVPLPEDLERPLRRYLSYLPQEDALLFLNRSGRMCDRRDILYIVKRRGLERGIQSVTAQRLRPTVVKNLIQSGVSETLIIKLLRHSDGRTFHTNYSSYLHDELGAELNTKYHPIQEAN
jgi:integrase